MSQTPAENRRIPEQSLDPTPAIAVRPAPRFHPLIASPWHTLLVLAVQGFVSYRGIARATQLQTLANPDRIRLYERTMFFEWLVLGVVLVGVWWHGSSLESVLGERWRSLRRFLRDLGIGVLFLVVAIVVGSVLSHGIESSAARAILPHSRAEMLVWIALSLTAGICEEALYRGYLQRQFIAMTRNVPAGILLSAALFGMAHGYQGAGQALQIAALGAMGGILAHWCKSVRPGMIAHILQDVLGGLIRHS
jgi:membrane protease YdiL (CAAX protease family)